jgi:hypothetical protein
LLVEFCWCCLLVDAWWWNALLQFVFKPCNCPEIHVIYLFVVFECGYLIAAWLSFYMLLLPGDVLIDNMKMHECHSHEYMLLKP